MTASITFDGGGVGPLSRLAVADNGDGTVSLLMAKQSASYATRADIFTGATSGVTVNCATRPMKWFSISVQKTGTVTSWTVVLEASLDGVTFTTVATHTNVIGVGVLVASAAATPALYFRTRCTALVLGLGTSITATALAME